MKIAPLMAWETVQGMVELYSRALANGQNPREVGLPPLPDPSLFLIEEGDRQVVASIRSEGDFDTARNRLQATPVQEAPVEETKPEPEPSEGQGDDAPEPKPEQTPEPPTEPEVPERPAKKAGRPKDADRPVPATLMRQIEAMAGMKSVPVPALENAKQAKAFWRELKALPEAAA